MRQCLADDQALQEELGERWDAIRDHSLDRAVVPRAMYEHILESVDMTETAGNLRLV